MGKRYHRKMIMLGLALALVLICATACVSSTAEAIELGDETIPSLYAVVGERKISGTSSSAYNTENGGSRKELTYADGAVSEDDAAAYLEHLQDEGFTIMTETEDEGMQVWQVAKPSPVQDGKLLVVTMELVPGGSAVIKYFTTPGTLG